MKKLSWTFILISILSASCVKKQSNSSNPEWGHLGGAWASYFIAAVPPDGSITFCGGYAKQAAEAAGIWAAEIGRKDRLKIYSDCRTDATMTFNTYRPNPDDIDPTAESGRGKGCKEVPSGSEETAAGYANVVSRVIKVCNKYSDSQIKALMLHETGHLWGMCDQYGKAVNCDLTKPNISSGKQVTGSVMGGNWQTALAADDKLGIQKLADREDVPNYELWRDLKRPGQTTKPGTSFPPEANMDAAQKCAAAGGTWGNFGINDGAMRCDCGNMLYHESVMGSYTLAQLKQLCGGGATTTATPRPNTTSTPLPGTPTPGPTSGSDDLATWCAEAKGTYSNFGQPDGMQRCQCPGGLWIREDAMRYYGHAGFLAQCK